MTKHITGTRKEWLAARLELLEAEKELTRRSDELARRRQELPWVRIDKEYRFETDEGSASLADLFRGRSQLLVYHFMFGPDYTAGCPSCSGIADRLPRLFHLCARTGRPLGHVPVARPRTQGAQRDGRLVAPPRRVRQGLREAVVVVAQCGSALVEGEEVDPRSERWLDLLDSTLARKFHRQLSCQPRFLKPEDRR